MRRIRWMGALALAALLLSQPRLAAAGAARAMAHWYATVAPAVLPFLALMPLLTCAEAAQAYERLLGRVMGALFDLPGAAAPAMVIGMVAGSPAGAMAARRVAAGSGMDRGQLQRVAVAAAGFSPAFIVSGIGEGLLGSAALGWRLAGAQALTQLALALLLRRAWRDRTQPVPAARSSGEDAPVRGAVLAALTICGYMALFGALGGALGAYLGDGAAGALLCLADVPSGARWAAALATDLNARLVLLAAMVGFGGACVLAQNLSALGGCGLRAVEYVALRILAAALCAGITALGLRLEARGLPPAFDAVRAQPLAAAGLCAALLAVPALLRLKKSIS